MSIYISKLYSLLAPKVLKYGSLFALDDNVNCKSPARGFLVKFNVKVLFNVAKYFHIKWFIHEQDLGLNYQTLLDKCMVQERSVLSYQKAQGDKPSPKEEGTVTIDALRSKTPWCTQNTHTDRHTFCSRLQCRAKQQLQLPTSDLQKV